MNERMWVWWIKGSTSERKRLRQIREKGKITKNYKKKESNVKIILTKSLS